MSKSHSVNCFVVLSMSYPNADVSSVKLFVSQYSFHTTIQAVPSLDFYTLNQQFGKTNLGVVAANTQGSNHTLVQLQNPPFAAVLHPYINEPLNDG